MSRGQYLSLEEARRRQELGFEEEHPSEGDKEKFDSLMRAMTKMEGYWGFIVCRVRPSGGIEAFNRTLQKRMAEFVRSI